MDSKRADDVKDPVETRHEVTEPSRLQDVLPNLGKPWYKVPHLLKLNCVLLIPLITSYLTGFDGSMMNGLQAVPVWKEDFNHPKGAILAVLSTMQTIGNAVAIPICPIIADRYGRRWPIFIGALIGCLASAIQGAAENMGMFLAGRFLIGLGTALSGGGSTALIAELSYPSHRGIITSIYNTSYYLGAIVAAWITHGTFKIPTSWSWRIPSILQALPCVIQLAFLYFLPESPRWLIANDRLETARQVLSQYHAGTTEPNELVRWEVEEISAALEAEKDQKSSSYMHFFKTPGNRHRLIICISMGFIIQWCGNGLVSHYLIPVLVNIGITDENTQNTINGILQVVNYVTSLSAAFFVDRLGRRKLFLISTIGMALCFAIWTALSAVNDQQGRTNESLGIGVVVMIFVFFVFYNIAMNPIPVAYLLEILPFTLRAKGFAIFGIAQMSSVIFNGFANPIALEAIGWRYYTVFACLIVVWLILIWFFYPETRGRSLEEVAIIFDGEKAMATMQTLTKKNSRKESV